MQDQDNLEDTQSYMHVEKLSGPWWHHLTSKILPGYLPYSSALLSWREGKTSLLHLCLESWMIAANN